MLEACRLLEDRGLVSARPQSGHYVTARAGVDPGGARALDPPSAEARHVDASLAAAAEPRHRQPPGTHAGRRGAGPRAHADRRAQPAARSRRCATSRPRATPTTPRRAARPCAAWSPSGAPTPAARVGPDEIVVTSGAKEAVYLSIRAVTRPGDTIAVESPTYYALLEVVASLGLQGRRDRQPPPAAASTSTTSTGRCGPSRSPRWRSCRTSPTRPAPACPTTPSAGSSSCSTPRRAARRGRRLRRPGLRRPRAHGDQGVRHGAAACCTASSFSKTLSPGLRVGWAIPGRYQNELELLKLVVNQATAVAPAAGGGRASSRAAASTATCAGSARMYRDQMERTIDAVARHFPAATRMTRPRGGHVLWVQLPGGVDSMELYEAAGRHGIRIAPGPMFSASLRLPQLHPPQHRLPLEPRDRAQDRDPRPPRRRPGDGRSLSPEQGFGEEDEGDGSAEREGWRYSTRFCGRMRSECERSWT